MSRRVIDSIVRNDPRFMEFMMTELYVQEGLNNDILQTADKVEHIKLSKKQPGRKLTLIDRVITAYNRVNISEDFGIIKMPNGEEVKIPVNNLRMLKALISCSKNSNQDFSEACKTMTVHVYSNSIKHERPSKILQSEKCDLMSVILDELGEFYVKQCS